MISSSEPQHRPTWRVVIVAIVLALAWTLLVAYANEAAPRAIATVLVGLALGATLLGTEFGFAGAFRRAVVDRDLDGLRSHAVAFAVAMVLMVPMVAAGEVLGAHVEGIAHGIGVGFASGAIFFGVGMQLAGGCASGTLYQLGGGTTKHIGTVLGFVLGSVIAASHVERWWALPALRPITLFSLGALWPLGLALELLAIAVVFRALGRSMPPRRAWVGAILLAVLNAATMIVASRPWSETWAFTLWGSQLAARAGAHPETWRLFRDTPWATSPLVDRTSIMDVAIPIGALLCAGALGTFTPRRASPRVWLAATLGGVLMGYGARLSGGCNIGAYFSDIATGDLSGWIWAIAAAGGSWAGVRLRRSIEGPS